MKSNYQKSVITFINDQKYKIIYTYCGNLKFRNFWKVLDSGTMVYSHTTKHRYVK